MTTYYVSPTGNDSNSGTSPGYPWRTITKVNAGHYKAGDCILFEGGQTFSGSLNFTASSWPATAAAAHPFTIGSYGSGSATINSGSAGGFLAHNVAGFNLVNLNFVGHGSTSANGVRILNDLPGNVKLDYVYLANLHVSGYGGDGVLVDGENGSSGFKNVNISDVTADNNTGHSGSGTAGIIVTSLANYGFGDKNAANEDVLIDHCVSYSNPGTAGNSNWSGSGIMMANVNGGAIQSSVAADNGAHSWGTVGIWAADATNVKIQYNESYGTMTTNGSDGDGFDLDGGVTNSVMQYNYSHDNAGAGYLVWSYNDGRVTGSSNLTVRYNVSQNDGRTKDNWYGSITIGDAGGTLTGVDVYNNTVYQSLGNRTYAATIQGSSASSIHALVANNIFYATNGSRLIKDVAGSPNVSFTGNDYYSTDPFSAIWRSTDYTSLASWQDATGEEKIRGKRVGTTANPRLDHPGGGGITGGYDPAHLTAYELLSVSPLHGAGLDLHPLYGINAGTHDYYGNPLPSSGSDIGAFQHRG
jgi:hypothetical protein